MAGRLARRAGLNADAVTNLGIYCALAALAGRQGDDVPGGLRYYAEHPGEIFSLSTLQAGGVFYGGLIAAPGGGRRGTCARRGCRRLATADVFAPAIALGHGIGRLGCFSAGCCWGVECHLPWAVTFTRPGRPRTGGRAAGRAAASHAALRSLRGIRHLRRPLLALRPAARARRHHQPVPDALRRSAFRGGVLPLPRAGQPVGRRRSTHRSGFRWCWSPPAPRTSWSGSDGRNVPLARGDKSAESARARCRETCDDIGEGGSG